MTINKVIKGYNEKGFDLRLYQSIVDGHEIYCLTLNGYPYGSFGSYKAADEHFEKETNDWAERTQ
jgi:hypothetical protein